MSSGTPRATRRQFLAGLAAATAVGLLGRTAAAGAAGPPGPSLVEPEVLTSSAGRLEVILRAAPVDLPWGSGTRYALAYGGRVPGPTLRVRPGDRLVVRLENGLDRPTNLHTHGLHVPPAADDVFIEVPPGAARTYTYDIPADHSPGLFWYHPHVHPWVAEQVSAGLAGALVVEDPDAAALPRQLAGATERLLVLADPPVGSTAATLAVPMAERMTGREGDAVLVNGLRRPRIDAVAGTLERWRVLNASPSRFYRLALDGHRLVRIGSDQGFFATPESRREVLLAPGERADVLVAPTRAGHYALRTLPYDRGRPMGTTRPSGRAAERLATLVVTGTAPAAPIPTGLPARSTAVPLPDTTRLVDLAMAMATVGGMPAHGSMMHDAFTINGKTFDPDRVDVAPPLGSTQEWVIRNATTMDHPIHLHSWPFVVTRRSDDMPLEPGWKDTVNVPAGAEVRIRIPFVDFTGRSVYHCHILDHEDLGMMATVEVR
jgi:FtsP/CotA-like multicopper oxidase with cupredoxin domain